LHRFDGGEISNLSSSLTFLKPFLNKVFHQSIFNSSINTKSVYIRKNPDNFA